MSTPPIDPDAPPVLSPTERLDETRARLRRSWLREPAPQDPSADADRPDDADESRLHRLGHVVSAGWARHPLKATLDNAASVAGPAVHAALDPMARRHPVRLIALAAGVGACIVWLRPWRWLPRAALSSVLISALLPRAAIARWFASGEWMDFVRSRSTSPAAKQAAADRPAPDRQLQPSDPAAAGDARASYAGRASSPIQTGHAVP